ncbi:UbiX family flavin prenyltransferase [Actinocrispum wychmicini]|uniref:Flavin prenyltransferase UbiX n=1 Tax=Actinocrispum wychmicini TaxID=1213861 RepID=A0A4R2JMS1_9PSEU|nr:UbiX family flavin prenyltransferase [Actinocrispum wychmicini]TCO59922.1 4-hydroxy-3-polyprenylbenzoate decarboxylase [Actinocrispum wychmicini]
MTRLVVGMSGASGAVYGIRMLEILKGMSDVETHLVMSPAARQTIALETSWKPRDVESLADVTYRHGDIAAAISSGSFPAHAMIILPCSVRTLGAVAWSQNDDLLTRAADVTLKERRKLVIALRETPLHLGHLRAMTQVTEMGAILAPLMPSFYGRPATVADLVDHTVGRLFDLLGITPPDELVSRWTGPTAG